MVSKEMVDMIGFECNPEEMDEIIENELKVFCRHANIDENSVSRGQLMSLYIYCNHNGNVIPDQLKKYAYLQTEERMNIKQLICYKYFLDITQVTFYQCAYLLACAVSTRSTDIYSHSYPERYEGLVDSLFDKFSTPVDRYLDNYTDKYAGLLEMAGFFEEHGTSLTDMIDGHGILLTLHAYAGYVVDSQEIERNKPDMLFRNHYFNAEFDFWKVAAEKYLRDKFAVLDDDNIYNACYNYMCNVEYNVRSGDTYSYNFIKVNVRRTNTDDTKVSQICERIRRFLMLVPIRNSDMLLFCTYWHTSGFYDLSRSPHLVVTDKTL